MKVRITIVDSETLVVEQAGVFGGGFSANQSAIVRKGERWRGWKFRRLKRLGDGEHDLFAKSDPLRNRGRSIDIEGG